MYQSTLWRACKCTKMELAKNWLSCGTAKVMSGLVVVRQKSVPTNLLQIKGLGKNSLELLIFKWFFIGVEVGLAVFLSHSEMPGFDLIISDPKKNFKSPKSLILKEPSRNCLILMILDKSLAVNITSSTYTRITVKELALLSTKRE